MKVAYVVSAMMVFGSLSMVEAKCFTFQNTHDVGVCVPGDSFDSRKKAKEICDSEEGNCGNVVSSSSRCHSNSGKCYDERGNKSRDLSDY